MNVKKFLSTIHCADMTINEVLEETDTYPVTIDSLKSDLQDEDLQDDQKLLDINLQLQQYLQNNPGAKVYQHICNDESWQYVDLITGEEVAKYSYSG